MLACLAVVQAQYTNEQCTAMGRENEAQKKRWHG